MKAYLHSNKAIFRLVYHIIWCPKYRWCKLEGEIRDRLMEIVKQLCIERGYEIIAFEVMPDHVHICVSAVPQESPHRIVKSMKGRTSNVLRKEFIKLKRGMPTLWSRSYFIASLGSVSEETVKRYIEDQWKK